MAPEETPPDKGYSGVFDLPPEGGGLTESERLLARLCRKSFLSLWAFPNLHTDEGFNQGRGAAKEFTDVLLVFGDDVVLFSDKHVAFNEGKTVEVAWARWYRRAILKSANQLHGALHWLKRFPNRIFLDAKCTRRPPIKLPDPSRARHHLVAVTRGSYSACSKWYPGSLGTLQIRSDIGVDPDPNRPFSVGLGDRNKPFVHILDEFSLEVILEEFDTAVDFITYLRAREDFLTDPNHVVMATGEEQLVASYLLNMIDEKHWFTPAFEDGQEPSLVSFDESLYPSIRERPEYQAKKQADRASYFWDKLIEGFIRLGDPKIVNPDFVQDNAQTEEALRIIASESRFRRRMLTDAFREALLKAKEKPMLRWMARSFAVTEDSDRVYVFLIFPKSDGDTYEKYRKYRVSVLHAYCRCLKLKFPVANTFVGLAFDHPLKSYKGSSEDLFIYKCETLTDAELQETERYRRELNILPDTLELQRAHADEFPPPTQNADSSPFEHDQQKTPRQDPSARRKRKRAIAKASRRRNRGKK
jgi:hypothetical protein